MVNIVRFPRRDSSVHEEAAQWVARLDKGLSDAQRAELDRWLNADRRRRDALLELAELWDGLNVLEELSALFPLEQPAPARRGRAALRWAVAASVACLAVAVGIVAFHGAGPDEPARVETVSRSLSTMVGERSTERLRDGSLVQLNTDTQILVEFSGGGRDIVLQRGEAHFDVARDASRPFSVQAGERVVQAVGTAFNVKLSRKGGLEVMVTEGEVKVGRLEASGAVREAAPVVRPRPQPPRFDTTLVEGEIALLDHSPSAQLPDTALRIRQLAPADIDDKLAWQRGMLAFRGEPLEDVLDEMARYTTAEFVLGDESLRDVRVGGYYRAGDIDGLLIALRETFGIDSERVAGDRIVLRRKR